jgi:hypothetical protein
LVILALAAIASVSIDMLGDATQTRPDPSRPNSRTEVVFRVQTLGQPALAAAQGLWGACQGTALRTVLPPGMTALGDNRFRMVVQPALGRHARDRMTGCLEDMTLDRVKGKVVSMRELSDR